MADLSVPRHNPLFISYLSEGSISTAWFGLRPDGHVGVSLGDSYLAIGREDAATLGRWLLAWCQPDVRVVCSDCPRP